MRKMSLQELRAGVLMKPLPFVVFAGTPDEFEIDLMPLSGEHRMALLADKTTELRGLVSQRMAVAFATGLTDAETDKQLPVPAIEEIGTEVLQRAGLFAKEEPTPKAEPPEVPAVTDKTTS